MTADPQTQLVSAAAKLAQAAPNSWDDFLRAFDQHSQLQAHRCIQSPPDQLATTQGRAQNSAELLRLLANCIQLADPKKGK
jgi:hypothetical protein